jgi:hypothetical protein
MEARRETSKTRALESAAQEKTGGVHGGLLTNRKIKSKEGKNLSDSGWKILMATEKMNTLVRRNHHRRKSTTSAPLAWFTGEKSRSRPVNTLRPRAVKKVSSRRRNRSGKLLQVELEARAKTKTWAAGLQSVAPSDSRDHATAADSAPK